MPFALSLVRRRAAARPARPALLALLALASGGPGCGSSSVDPVTSIGEARELAPDTEVTIEGVITVPSGLFNSSTGEQGFAVQDATGGIYVSSSEAVPGAIGQRVQVTGKLGALAQMIVLSSDPASVVSTGETGEAPIAAVATGDVGDGVEGRLVRVTGVVTEAVVDDRPYGLKVFLDDGSGRLQIFVNLVGGEPLVDVSTLMVDQSLTVAGLAARYEQTVEVMPRAAADASAR